MKLLKKLRDKKGLGLIEAVASNIIIALVIITTMSIIINLRLQSAIAEERYRAYQDADTSRQQMIDRILYPDLVAAINISLGRSPTATLNNGETYTLTHAVALATGGCPTGFRCDLMFNPNGNNYPTSIEFVVLDRDLKLIDFAITVSYFNTRTLIVEGMIYG